MIKLNKNLYKLAIALSAVVFILALTVGSEAYCIYLTCGEDSITAKYTKFIGDELAFLEEEFKKTKAENTNSMMKVFFKSTKNRKPVSSNYLVSRTYFLKSLAAKEKAAGQNSLLTEFEYLTLVDQAFRDFSKKDLYLNFISINEEKYNRDEMAELKQLDEETIQKTVDKWKIAASAIIEKAKSSNAREISSGPSRKEWDDLAGRISSFQIKD